MTFQEHINIATAKLEADRKVRAQLMDRCLRAAEFLAHELASTDPRVTTSFFALDYLVEVSIRPSNSVDCYKVLFRVVPPAVAEVALTNGPTFFNQGSYALTESGIEELKRDLSVFVATCLA